MKVVFLLNGLTHYVIPILNRLNEVNDIEVIAVSASNLSNNVGTGVYITNKGINFRVVYLDEVDRFYGKTFFKGVKPLLKKESVDVIILGWPFILELVFNPFFLIFLKNSKIKILFKEIPFQVQPFYDAIKFKNSGFMDENLNCLDKNILTKINYLFIALIRRYYYSFVDASINYIENSYELLKTFGVKKESIFISYNSPDIESLFIAKQKAAELSPILSYNTHRLIHVGRLVKWKRVDLLLNAVADLSKSFTILELLIIGDGPELNPLKLLAEKLGISSKVLFVGAIYESIELARYFNSGGIYVLGGMGGLSINEAMAFGKPIICSICDGTEKKLVRDGFNGYIFENGNLESLKSKIVELISDDDKIIAFGKNSESIIRYEINLQTVINGYVAAFEYLMRKSRHL